MYRFRKHLLNRQFPRPALTAAQRSHQMLSPSDFGWCCCFIISWCEYSSALGVTILAVTWVSDSRWQLPPPPFSPGFQTPADPIVGGSDETKKWGGRWEEYSEQDAQVETEAHRATQVISSAGVEWALASSELRLRVTFTAYNTRLVFLNCKFLF